VKWKTAGYVIKVQVEEMISVKRSVEMVKIWVTNNETIKTTISEMVEITSVL